MTLARTSYAELAAIAIAGETLTRDQCREVLEAPDAEILALLQASYEVRKTFVGNSVHLHVLMNAKSGACQEDCGYCSQSKVSSTDIPVYPLVDEEQMLEGARQAKAAKAKRFCMVIATRGPSWPDVERISAAVRRIKQEVDIGICVSVGLLNEDKAQALHDAGVEQLNHNLNTSESYYSEICTTHTYEDRMQTLQAARNAGLNLCTGAIFGMGERQDDIIDLLLELRGLDVQSIPINFLIPIEGTPLQESNYLSPQDCLRILCLARFLNPRQEIRVSGGREFHLRSLQPLSLYPANSIFVDGYLTEPGQPAGDAWRMIRDMGFEIEEHVEGEPQHEAPEHQPAATR